MIWRIRGDGLAAGLQRHDSSIDTFKFSFLCLRIGESESALQGFYKRHAKIVCKNLFLQI